MVDAGDLFLPLYTSVEPDAGEIARRARLLTAAFARIGTSAFTPGERDLAMGPALLARLLTAAKVPVVSANLADSRGKLLFPPDRLVDVAGTKIGIFGVTQPLPADAARWKTWGIQALDAVAAARKEVQALRARGARIVVALVHVGALPEARRVIGDAPGIDWAVLGHAGMSFETPETVGDTQVLDAFSQGKNLGRLDLHLVGPAPTGRIAFTDRGGRAQVEVILADHRRQLDDYRKRTGEAKEASMRNFFSGRIAEIDKAIARETALLATLPSEIAGSWFENRIIPLDATVPDQAGVALLVAAYNQENARRAAAGKVVGLGQPGGHPPPPAKAPVAPGAETSTYAGTAACGACHKAALEVWRGTKHAHAMEALAKLKRDRDPTCVGCHVTGFLRPGGTTDIAVATTRLREVGCEACHGPGLAHARAPEEATKEANAKAKAETTMRRQVPASVCLGCHTPDQTNGDFDYPTFVKAIIRPGHGL